MYHNQGKSETLNRTCKNRISLRAFFYTSPLPEQRGFTLTMLTFHSHERHIPATSSIVSFGDCHHAKAVYIPLPTELLTGTASSCHRHSRFPCACFDEIAGFPFWPRIPCNRPPSRPTFFSTACRQGRDCTLYHWAVRRHKAKSAHLEQSK